MNNSLTPRDSADDELWSLVEAFCDGAASAAQRSMLNARLAVDPNARLFYLGYLQVHAELAWKRRGAIDPDMAPKRPRSVVLRILGPAAILNRPVFWSSLVVALMFYGTFTVISWNLRGDNLSRDTKPAERAIATIQIAKNVRWSPDSKRRRVDSAVRRGELLKIDAGLVELHLERGAILLVDGPAAWSIDGDNRATLKRGRLLAKVPEAAVGFTLTTPTAEIVDLGTEFGVEVVQDGTADVHVLKGQVNVRGTNGSENRQARQLRAGQSVRITSTGAELQSDPKIATKFARLAQDGTDKKNKIAAENAMSIRYAQCVRELSPLVYFPIERNETLTLTDRAEGKYVGKFSRSEGPGDPWEKGPFGDAVRFRGARFSDRVTVLPKDPQSAKGEPNFSRGKEPGLPFSIALWARCQPGQSTGLLVGKGAGFQEQYLFDILDGRFRFVTISADRKSLGEISSKTPFDGAWQHVAAVFDADRKSISLYVNGKQESTAELQDVSLFATDEATYIGNRPFQGDEFKLTIDGALDEIAIFPTALRAQEIDSMYRLQSVRAPPVK